MNPPQTNSLTLYSDNLRVLRRESSPDGARTLYHLEQLSCDDPVIVCDRQTFERQSDALAAFAQLVRRMEERTAADIDLERKAANIKRAAGGAN